MLVRVGGARSARWACADALRLHLEQAGLTVATCESCTGGAIGAALTDRPGASRVFKGGLQTYADEAKVALVGVPADLLGSGGPGAVSEATAKAMAQGARSRLQSDVSVSVTGIAGPDGGTPIKPVGTVWIATACQAQVRARCVRIRGDRARVRTWTIHAACMSLLWHLQGLDVKTQWDVST